MYGATGSVNETLDSLFNMWDDSTLGASGAEPRDIRLTGSDGDSIVLPDSLFAGDSEDWVDAVESYLDDLGYDLGDEYTSRVGEQKSQYE
jgi:hypothetical protein